MFTILLNFLHFYKITAMENLSVNESKKTRNSLSKNFIHVDMTPMVDLGFLLITFFMLTTSLSKMRALDIAKPIPIDNPADAAAYPASRTMTILLGRDNKVVYYMGETAKASMGITNLVSIKKQILANKDMVANTHEAVKDKRMLVIIKPTNTSTYKNFVYVIDEMNIAKIETYAIDDQYISAQEKVFIKAKGL